MEDDDKFEVVFAPGCFDGFTGSQEELDELVAEIQRMVDTGELFDNLAPISDEMLDELSDEQRYQIEQFTSWVESQNSTDELPKKTKKTLH